MVKIDKSRFYSFYALNSGKKTPTTAVNIINNMVFIAPILSPILINSNISIIGSAIIDISIVFICLIQKYIINVYLANNE